MSTDERFIELWNDHLEGELDESDAAELRRLLAQDDRLVQLAADSYRTHRLLGLMARRSESQQDDFVQQTLNRLPAEDDSLVGAATAQVPRGAAVTTRPPERSLETWRWIMRSPISRAAVLVLAIAGVAFWFSGGGATYALADFLEPIRKAKTVKFKVTTEFAAQSAQLKLLPEAMQQALRTTTGEVMMLGATRTRRETVNPDKSKTIHIWDGGQGKRIALLPAQKRAQVFDDAKKRREKTPDGGDPVAGWRSMLLDTHDRPDSKRESLGEKVIDGRQVVGFRISSPAIVFEVWGDPKTGLPARVGWTTAAVPDVKVTLSDFEFNVDMDESLFSVEPPEGYEVGSFFITTPTIDGSTTKEKDLIETLREYSRLSGGPFPTSLDQWSLTQLIYMEFTSDRMQKPGAKQELAETQAKLQPGLMFRVQLPPEADAHYAGKGVSLGAADTPVFWYRPKDSEKYRVIYADLSVRDADAPPSVPDALPEQDLIDTFRYYTELSGGPFPDSLDLESFLQNVAMNTLSIDSLVQQDKASLKQTQETMQARMKQDLVKFQPGLIFTASLPPEANSRYAGKGVALGAVDTPIFWYRPKDSETYRVVYADLSVRDAETPPSVPDAQPEEDLIDTFRYYSELSGGPFPDSLDLLTMTEVIGRDFAVRMFLELAPHEQRHKIKELLDLQRLAREREKPNKEQITKIEEQIFDLLDWEKLAPGKGKPNKEQMTKIIEAETQKFMKAQIPKNIAATMRLQRGLLFATQLSPEADAHYAGTGVSLGAADTPIFWYRPKDSETYRIIYADLSVREAETPPSVPEAQPVPAPPSPKE